MRAQSNRRVRRLIEAVMLLAAFCVMVPSALGQTLADVARQEEARRRSIKKPAKVYTNASLKPAPSGEGVPVGTPLVTVPAEQPPPAANAQPAAPEATAQADPAKDEAYWRKRIGDARAQRERNAVYLESLENRINGLWAEFTARDDPAQRAVIAQNRQRAIDERDRLQKDQLALEKQIKDIEEEARRANVPPGWLR